MQQLLANFDMETEAFERMPVKLKDLIESELGVLKNALASGPIKPLAAFVFIGE